jgi:hypothetical protein
MPPQTRLIESPYNVDIPVSDIPSWVFSAGTEETRREPQYFDADNPARYFSLSEAELYVKQVALGLQRLGLQANDKVLLFSPNKLYFPVLLWGTIAARCVFTAVSPSAQEAGMWRLTGRRQNSAADTFQSSRTNWLTPVLRLLSHTLTQPHLPFILPVNWAYLRRRSSFSRTLVSSRLVFPRDSGNGRIYGPRQKRLAFGNGNLFEQSKKRKIQLPS